MFISGPCNSTTVNKCSASVSFPTEGADIKWPVLGLQQLIDKIDYYWLWKSSTTILIID